MNVPVLVLLGFAAWTLLTLVSSVGIYRWSNILAGRTSISYWRADEAQGSDLYRRSMRAHLNCVENLPVYASLVVALTAVGLKSATVDQLALAMLAARIGQTTVHIGMTNTNWAAGLRFGLFALQLVCMFAIGAIVVQVAVS
jgi:uncharacterized MAPEG superfamily protein